MLDRQFMHSDARFVAGLAAALALTARPSRAQTASPAPPETLETLETPYEEPSAPPVVPAVPPPAAAAPASPHPAPGTTTGRPAPARPLPPSDIRPPLPIRARRKLALTAELGWNGLAGLGPVLTYHAHPHFSLDLGGGISLFGWKAGVRGRYNLLTSPLTPFIGAGFSAGAGLGEVSFNTADDPNADPTRDPVTVDLKPSYLIQAVLGLDFVHKRGFTLVGGLGYAFLLNENNYEVLAGELTKDEERGFKLAFKSGPVLSIALGYSFE